MELSDEYKNGLKAQCVEFIRSKITAADKLQKKISSVSGVSSDTVSSAGSLGARIKLDNEETLESFVAFRISEPDEASIYDDLVDILFRIAEKTPEGEVPPKFEDMMGLHLNNVCELLAVDIASVDAPPVPVEDVPVTRVRSNAVAVPKPKQNILPKSRRRSTLLKELENTKEFKQYLVNAVLGAGKVLTREDLYLPRRKGPKP